MTDNQILSALRSHPDVADGAVVRTPAEAGALTIAVAAVTRFVSGTALREQLWAQLGPDVAPDGVIVVDVLPPDGGQADVAAIDDLAALTYQPPADELEAEIAQIWSSVLGGIRVGVRDDFLDLGGESLEAVQIIVALEERFGPKFDEQDFFDADNVRDLARVLRERGLS
jgi:acyl carrier protein